jgi:NAD(P)-dependent dehydrogenase (short-subunit alcohol dehydrogenase family)
MEPFRPDLLAGKTTVITGGGTGLGRSTALRLAGLGARVGILGRRPEPLQEVVEKIRSAGGTAAAVPCDVREPDAVDSALDRLEKELGPANQLVNNAAGNFLAASEDLSPRAFDAVVRIVLYGTVHCTLALGRRLIERKQKGEILSIATTYAESGSAFVLPSATAKAGVLAMTRSLAVEGHVRHRSTPWPRVFPPRAPSRGCSRATWRSRPSGASRPAASASTETDEPDRLPDGDAGPHLPGDPHDRRREALFAGSSWDSPTWTAPRPRR